MCGSGVIIWYPIIFICCFDEVQHGFKFPDHHHIMVNPDKIFTAVYLFFLFNRFIVLVYRNFPKFDELWFPDNFWIDVLTFWHILICLLNLIFVSLSPFLPFSLSFS